MLGIFDSGSGGLTALREVVNAFPGADLMYLGDHARAPYGDRDPKEIKTFTKEAVAWLFAQGCDEILFACNTASSIVLPELNDDRVFGIVEPTLAWLDGQRDRHIGLLATQATVDSGAYASSVAVEQACPAWSILIENGDARTDEAREVVARDVERLFATDANIDAIVLACTHYPIFHEYVVDALPRPMPVMYQGQMLVDWMKMFSRNRVAGKKRRVFFTTGNPDKIVLTAAQAFGTEVRFEKITL